MTTDSFSLSFPFMKGEDMATQTEKGSSSFKIPDFKFNF